MSDLAYKLDEMYTYSDYLSWDSDERYEIIDGIAYSMASPNLRHQSMSGELYATIREFLKDKPCKVISAPFDVRLFPEDDDSDITVVQPDILVVCDQKKLSDGRSCKGAPDLIVEILSKTNRFMDLRIKAQKYQEAGVKEYWVVNAETLEIMVNVLTNGCYVSTVYNDIAKSSVLPGLTADLNLIKERL